MQGNLMGVMAVLKGTPTTYNKDFQECWDLMFDAVDSLHDSTRIATGVLSTLSIKPDKMMKVGGRVAVGGGGGGGACWVCRGPCSFACRASGFCAAQSVGPLWRVLPRRRR
jgi:hypothetical protein